MKSIISNITFLNFISGIVIGSSITIAIFTKSILIFVLLLGLSLSLIISLVIYYNKSITLITDKIIMIERFKEK